MSADEIGADCRIGQNVTIGTNGKGVAIADSVNNHKPRIGNVVSINAGAIISGRVHIGQCVIVGAGAFVDKDVPDYSVVYG